MGTAGEEQLIGVIDAGTRTIKFCVFRSEHTKEIAEHTINIATQTPEEGWSEQDPLEILNAVKTCMQRVVDDLGPQGKFFNLFFIKHIFNRTYFIYDFLEIVIWSTCLQLGNDYFILVINKLTLIKARIIN